jgi:hypothetical protein
MNNIQKAIELLKKERTNLAAKFAIVNEGFQPESSIVSTKDGYINISITILEFVNEAEQLMKNGEKPTEDNYPHVYWSNDSCAYWGDRIKYYMYSIPSFNQDWIVGTYLFEDKRKLIDSIDQFFHKTDSDQPSLKDHPDFQT